MPDLRTPGTYVEEILTSNPTIAAAPTSRVAFLGSAGQGPVGEPVLVHSMGEFRSAFGASGGSLSTAVELFLANGGTDAVVVRLLRQGPAARSSQASAREIPFVEPKASLVRSRQALASGVSLTASMGGPQLDASCFIAESGGIRTLDKTTFNLLYIPPYRDGNDVDIEVLAAAAAYCRERNAMLIIDAPRGWRDVYSAERGIGNIRSALGGGARNAIMYFPYLRRRCGDALEEVPPGAAVAGVIARTDAQRGVWKAPAGTEAQIRGVEGTVTPLDPTDLDRLSPVAINGLRSMPGSGTVIWGARTLEGAEGMSSEWKYVPVRRLALFIEESLIQGLQWTVLEPNGEALWSRVRSAARAFLNDLYRRGAFQGASPEDTYFVKCDRETATQADMVSGTVNLVVGFAPLRPAEFVVVHVQLRAMAQAR